MKNTLNNIFVLSTTILASLVVGALFNALVAFTSLFFQPIILFVPGMVGFLILKVLFNVNFDAIVNEKDGPDASL